MAKQSGLLEKFIIDGVDLSGDVGSLSRIGSNSGVLDVTAIDKAALERILSHVDGAMEFSTFFNKAAAQEHLTLRNKAVADADRIAVWLHGSVIGGVAAGIVAKQINYDMARGQDGSLVQSTSLLGNNYGLDFADQLTAGFRTDGSATNGASHNNGAATTRGLSAYLEVLAFTGTSVTVALQQSSDNGGGDAFAAVTGGAFVAASAVGAQRIVTSLSLGIEQYLRVVTTGTFSNAIFSVIVSRWPYQ